MNTREIVLGAAAVLCTASLGLAQIAPQGQGAPQPRSQQPRADPTKSPMTTLAGCLYRENDYILADASPARGRNPLSDPPIADKAQPPDSPTAGLASGRMYRVTEIDDEQLKPLIGRRVEVTGTIKPDDDAKPADRDAHTNLPNIEGTSIRGVVGTACPATAR
jgi:hypothetical protein